MRDILNSSGIVISGIKVLHCRIEPVANVIASRTLGGLWQVQTVGTAAKQAAVRAKVVGLNTRKTLLDCWGSGTSVTIRFDGMAYTGIISELPDTELILSGPAARRIFALSFVLLITSEEAVT